VKRLRVITWRLRIAIAAAVAASVLVAASAWRATHFDELPNMSAPGIERSEAPMGSYRIAPVSELDRAVDRDPFHPERRRPQIRYQLPRAGPAVDPEAGTPIVEPIELIGTVVSAGGRSFAMCQTSAGPQIVHIGETLAGFTLKSVGQGSAVFVSPQGKVTHVRVKKIGS
jgi:hypothetical protein